MLREKSFSAKEGTFFDKVLQWLRFKKVATFVAENSVVCDLGCGKDGELLKFFENKIGEGIGVDILTDKNFSSKKIKLIEGNLNVEINLEDEYFDMVFSLAVIEHLDNYKKYLSEARRILKKEGVLILTTPTPGAKFILELLATLSLISKEEIKDHKRYFNSADLRSIMREVGFSEVKVKKFQMGFNNLIIAKK